SLPVWKRVAALMVRVEFAEGNDPDDEDWELIVKRDVPIRRPAWLPNG
ncbi:MAG: hypothetical protein HC806_10455, partial [Anaerolineae bacterium]|nr:hypothetical protein [Anaerolineae bacterium]